MSRYSIIAERTDHEAKIAEAMDGLLFALSRLGKCRNALPAARMHASDATAAIAKLNEQLEAAHAAAMVRRSARTLPAVPAAKRGSIMGACPDSPSLLR